MIELANRAMHAGQKRECLRCRGKGTVDKVVTTKDGTATLKETCPRCHGRGTTELMTK